jgi:ribokinase
LIPDTPSSVPQRDNPAKPAIVVVGSYNLDTAIELEAFPVPGETVIGNGARISHGGKGSNQSVQAARCGSLVSLIACLGNDPAGVEALDFWRLEGVGLEGVSLHGSLPTGAATILVDNQGENIIIVNPGANLAITAHAVVGSLSTHNPVPKILVTQLETPVEVAHAAFRWAREERVTTILNAAPLNAPLPEALIELTDILIVNEIEAVALVGSAFGEQDAIIAAQRLASKVRLAVILTRGALGAILFRFGSEALKAASPPTVVRDTTGAGDAFVGAFAAEFAATGSIEDAVAWGVAAGSYACRSRGAVPSYGSRADILACASGWI